MATQPCPCGYATDPQHECTCTTVQIQKYLSKISGPLLDRIDIHIDVPAVKYQDLAGEGNGETSNTIRQRVEKARDVQLKRFEGNEHIYFNADMEQQEIKRYCRLDDAG